MKRFIAYFDFLGYKEFILNNDTIQIKKRVEHIFRNIEISLGQGNFSEIKTGISIADLSKTPINCLVISDTVIFWTNDNSVNSLQNLLNVAFDFNFREIFYNFPIRGVLYCDEIEIIYGQQKNQSGSIYSPNLIYGQGLVKAHLKCENLNWSGSVIDQTVLDQIEGVVDVASFLDPFAKLYKVPYKDVTHESQEEYCLKIIKGELTDVSFENREKAIVDTFSKDNKSIDKPRVQQLLSNTIAYLKTFKEKTLL